MIQTNEKTFKLQSEESFSSNEDVEIINIEQ